MYPLYPLFLSKLVTSSDIAGIIYLRRESRIRDAIHASRSLKPDSGRANERERMRMTDGDVIRTR